MRQQQERTKRDIQNDCSVAPDPQGLHSLHTIGSAKHSRHSLNNRCRSFNHIPASYHAFLVSWINMKTFIKAIPKAELHLHIEGTLEPEMMMAMGKRNSVPLPYPDAASVRKAYAFDDLQSFLDIYYNATSVLLHEQDFYDLTTAYLKKAAAQNVRHAEIFFDPQTHTSREGIAFSTVTKGIHRALQDGEKQFGITTKLFLCILRHLSEKEGLETLEQALDYKNIIAGIGLDSSELGNPPNKFKELYKRANKEGFLTVAHAGEEGHADYIWQALNTLHVARIDHGVRCMEDEKLVEKLVASKVPLTVCPLSNVKLHIFPSMKKHNLKKMLDRGLLVTVNSDDPAYFGGYINENYMAVQQALNLDRQDIIQFAVNSFNASFLPQETRQRYLDEIKTFVQHAHEKTDRDN